jgi:hypothetical protein
MKNTSTLATLVFVSGLIGSIIAIFVLTGSVVLGQADPHAISDAAGQDHNVPRLPDLALASATNGTLCTPLLQAGGFEGGTMLVFAHWIRAEDPATALTGYLKYEGDFSMRLHASLGGNFPTCDPLAPWLYQTVRIPYGITTTTRITVGGYYAVGGSLADCSVYNSVDADDVLYVQMRDSEGIAISDPVTITHGGVVTETWNRFSVDFTEKIDLQSLAGQDAQVYFYATHDEDIYGTWFYLDNLEGIVCPHIGWYSTFLPLVVRQFAPPASLQ